jgi:hypothetical protein
MGRDPDLLTHFTKYFEILRADTPALLEELFRLRYQVYCQEGCLPGFDPADYPDGLEHDIYDYEHRSVHCLLRHRPTGSNAGTVRLVLADPSSRMRYFPGRGCGTHRPGLSQQILCGPRPSAYPPAAGGARLAPGDRRRSARQCAPQGTHRKCPRRNLRGWAGSAVLHDR